MKKLNLAVFSFVLFSCVSCDYQTQKSFILGKWGLLHYVSGYTNKTPVILPDLEDGSYYEIIEYKINGTYTITDLANNTYNGTYTYNEEDRLLRYKLDSSKDYLQATVSIESDNQIQVWTVYDGGSGNIFETFVRI